jgi:hypothetical protein
VLRKRATMENPYLYIAWREKKGRTERKKKKRERPERK